MIGAVRSWLTSIVSVTLILTVVQTLVPEGTLKKITGFTGGLLLLAALLQPVLKTDLGRLRLDFSDYENAIGDRTAELESAGKEELAALIAGRTAAYISDKAEELGVPCGVTVAVGVEDGVPLPKAVEMTIPYHAGLSQWLERELKIGEENQVWQEK